VLSTPRPPRRRRILFWGFLTGERPRDFVRTNISADRRHALATVLSQGQILESYLGWANCRICHSHLGSCDLGRFGFVWPQKAEHYIITHQVWTPDCDLLEAAARTR
jgi:hypothetical protein